MDINNNVPSLLTPAVREEKIKVRQKKRRLPIRVTSMALILIGALAIAAVGVAKISDGSIKEMIFDKLSGFLTRGDGTFASDTTSAPDSSGSGSESKLPVAAPVTSSQDTGGRSTEQSTGTSASAPESTGNAGSSGNTGNTSSSGSLGSSGDTDANSGIPKGAIRITDASAEACAVLTENNTHRSFDTGYLQAMKSTLLRSDSDGPLCLVIHTHSTEGYLPLGTRYYHPDSGELARSRSNEENVVAVGKVVADTLNAAGIPTLHVTLHHDSEGTGTSYVKSNDTVARYLAKYPSIKYVFDIHRSTLTGDDGSLVRDSVRIGDEVLARMRITVSGGSSLPDSSVNANLSLALKLNAVLCDFSSFLVRPVLISDAVYCASYPPRSLKIDVGSCASALEEAEASAVILAEAIASLLLS